MYIFTHIHTHSTCRHRQKPYAHTYIHTYIHTYMQVTSVGKDGEFMGLPQAYGIHTYIHTYIHACMHVTSVGKDGEFMGLPQAYGVCTVIYFYLCVCIYTCMYVYICDSGRITYACVTRIHIFNMGDLGVYHRRVAYAR
jgi:hypothetical protein